MKEKIGDSELIINPDGSIFHLHLKPEDIADTIILVGDQGRVDTVASFFDKVEIHRQNREFNTKTGYYKGKRISVVSTGIGTDNIDIVLNELDAITNIDLQKRIPKDEHKTLNLIRIGTSGSLQADIPVDTPVAAKIALGFDPLLNFYAGRNEVCHTEMEQPFMEHTKWNPLLHRPYFVDSSDKLFNTIAKDLTHGITISAPGFYGPQGRQLRLKTADPKLNEKLQNFKYNNLRITNYEMECSAIYGLSKLLGHNALTICNIIANRFKKDYSSDYKTKIKETIKLVLDRTLEL
jgi:uridine phosphorylase